MALPNFSYLYDHACERKGGEKALKALMPKTKSKHRLKNLGSDRYLAEFTRKIFQSGFVWRVVDKKWPQFEEVFWEFDIERLLMMPDDMLERKAQDPAIIRNFSKVKTVRENAMMIDDTERREHKSRQPARWQYRALRPAHAGRGYLFAHPGRRRLFAQPRHCRFGHHQPARAQGGADVLQQPAGAKRPAFSRAESVGGFVSWTGSIRLR